MSVSETRYPFEGLINAEDDIYKYLGFPDENVDTLQHIYIYLSWVVSSFRERICWGLWIMNEIMIQRIILDSEGQNWLWPSWHTALFQRSFKVDFGSRRWTNNFQRWNKVIDFNVRKTTHFQRRFNVRFQRWNNFGFQRWNNVRFLRWSNVRFQRWFVLTKLNVFSSWSSTLFQPLFSSWEITEIHFRYKSMLKKITTVIIYCLFNYGNYHDK